MKKVQTVAIIGGGPAGLAALFELLHVDNTGTSTVARNEFAEKCRFTPVLFERRNVAGGVWQFTKPGNELTFELTRGDDYNDPSKICPPNAIPDLSNATYESPFKQTCTQYPPPLEWYESAVYDSLYTNTPEMLMRFSHQPLGQVPTSELSPFIRHHEVLSNLVSLASMPEMDLYIRYDSSIQKIIKKNGQWEVIVRHKDGDHYNWYTQMFDAVIIASGRQNYPHYPVVKGLSELLRKIPEKISHSKNFRSASNYTNKVRKTFGLRTANLLECFNSWMQCQCCRHLETNFQKGQFGFFDSDKRI